MFLWEEFICLYGYLFIWEIRLIHLIRLNQWQKRLIWLIVDLVIRQWEKLLFAPYRFWKNVRCKLSFFVWMLKQVQQIQV